MARFGYAPFRAAYGELAGGTRRNLTQELGGLLGPGTHDVVLHRWGDGIYLCDRDYNKFIYPGRDLKLGARYRIMIGRAASGFHIGTDVSGRYHLVDNRDNCSVYESGTYGECLAYARDMRVEIRNLRLINIWEVGGES